MKRKGLKRISVFMILSMIITQLNIFSVLGLDIGNNITVFAATKTEKVRINKSTISLKVGGTQKLKVTITPASSKSKITWSSSNKKVAVVTSSGIVKAMGTGNAIITAKTSKGIKAVCKISVQKADVKATKITVSKKEISLDIDTEDYILKAVISPDNTTNKKVTWSSSNEDIVYVDDRGKLYLMDVGSAVITAKTSNGKKANVEVNVTMTDNEIKSIQLPQSKTIIEDNELQLNVLINPEGISLDELIWSSNNKEVAEVDQNGLVTANSTGVATIKVESSNGIYAECEIIVESGYDVEYVTEPSTEYVTEPVTEPATEPVTIPVIQVPTQPVTPAPTAPVVIVETPVRTTPSEGTYKIVLYGTNNVFNVYNNDTKNGTKVISFEWHDANNEIWRISHAGSQKLYFTPQSATDKVLDVMRENNSWNGALKEGCYADIYDKNDPQAQEFYMDKFNDGSFVIRLASNSALVLQAKSTSSNTEIVLAKYDVNNRLQRWGIESTSVTQSISNDNAAPNLYSNSYGASVNPFSSVNLYGQCTWYAWGRANEVKGLSLPCRGDAKTWLDTAKSKGYSTGQTPKKNSIAVWSNNSYGHVAYVEKVEGGNVTITESNWGKVTYNYQNFENGIQYYSGYSTLSESSMRTRLGTLLGYIYLE